MIGEGTPKLRGQRRNAPQTRDVNPLAFLFAREREEMGEELKELAFKLSGLVRDLCAPITKALVAGDKAKAMRAALPLAALTLSAEAMDGYLEAMLRAEDESGNAKAGVLLAWSARLQIPGLVLTVKRSKNGSVQIAEERWHEAAARMIRYAVENGDTRLEALINAMTSNAVCRPEDAAQAKAAGYDTRMAGADARATRTHATGGATIGDAVGNQLRLVEPPNNAKPHHESGEGDPDPDLPPAADDIV